MQCMPGVYQCFRKRKKSRIRGIETVGSWLQFLIRIVRVSLIEKVTFEGRLEGVERIGQVDI